MAVLILAVIFISMVLYAPPAQAVAIKGSGEEWARDVYSALTDRYLSVDDEASITYSVMAGNTTTGSATDRMTAAILDMNTGVQAFVSTSASALSNATRAVSSGPLHSVPFFATSMTIAYSTSEFANASSTNVLLLNVPVLTGIWDGIITTWSDPAIKALNPWITMPVTPITLVYCGMPYWDGDVLLRFLRKASPGGLARGGFASLPPVVDGRAVSACSATAKFQAAANLTSTIGVPLVMFMAREYANFTGVFSAARMRVDLGNGTQAVVSSNTAGVTAAMTAAAGAGTDITNLGAGGAWPLSTLVSVIVETDLSETNNCYMIRYAFAFISWGVLNTASSSIMTGYGFTPLDATHRRYALDTMGGVTCDGVRALSTAYVLGSGPLIPLYPALAKGYNQQQLVIRYYQSSSSLQAIVDMIDNAYDFGTSGATLTDAQRAIVPDVVTIPTVAYASIVHYNVPDVYHEKPIVMTPWVVAHIFMGDIDRWDHPNITDLNPTIAHLLPPVPITVLYVTSSQVITQVVNTFLSMVVPEYAEAVGNSSLGTAYPVVGIAPERTIALSTQSFISTVPPVTPYCFSVSNTFITYTSANMKPVSLKGSFSEGAPGGAIPPSRTYIANAISSYPNPLSTMTLYLPPSNNSWPMVSYNSVIIRSRSMTDCAKAAALVDWLYWVQSSSEASSIAIANQITMAGESSVFMKHILDAIVNVTCEGVAVSSLAGCVVDGTICSDRGTCTRGVCSCQAGWEGAVCETASGSDGDSTPSYVVAISTVIPAFAVILLILLCAGLAVLVAMRFRRQDARGDFQINPNEIEMGEVLGNGGFGEVRKAKWRGTEVAVKIFAASGVGGGNGSLDSRNGQTGPSLVITKEMQTAFMEEVMVMSALRHPNVVLFMGACTKPPKLCIIMEYMALGSLFDLIHNELVVDLPLLLILKVMYQAAKGMHFLHSSGIVHRDLKSLNLLLDAKWNVKVADFGLTKFKTARSKKSATQGTVHWMAPEVLSEAQDYDPILADVYAFGIIIWELRTRSQPYCNIQPAQIAVSVIRSNMRPDTVSKVLPKMKQPEYEKCIVPEGYTQMGELDRLMRECWHTDPVMRPAFLQIMERLSMINVDLGGSSMGATTSNSSSSASNSHSIGMGSTTQSISTTAQRPVPGLTETLTNDTGSMDTTSSSMDTLDGFARGGGGGGGGDARNEAARFRVPRTDVSFVVCDLYAFDHVWNDNCRMAERTIRLFSKLVRRTAGARPGPHHVFSTEVEHSGGTFALAFASTRDAFDFSAEMINACASSKSLPRYARFGVSWRYGKCKAPAGDPARVRYDPRDFEDAYRMCTIADPGEMACSKEFLVKLHEHGALGDEERALFKWNGTYECNLYRMDTTAAAESGGMSRGKDINSSDDESDESDGEYYNGGLAHSPESGRTSRAGVMNSVELAKRGVCSSNMCRFIIDPDQLQVSTSETDRIGIGSYGIVFPGTYKGIDVAVKQIVGKPTEDKLLNMRTEAAMLSSISHPNIVQLIGLMIKGSKMSLVMELCHKGNLNSIIRNEKRFPMGDRVRMMYQTALGIKYLHDRGIVHRDIKPTNLLLDKEKNIKVGDFGFARLRESTATMTACGSPLWMAPEMFDRGHLLHTDMGQRSRRGGGGRAASSSQFSAGDKESSLRAASAGNGVDEETLDLITKVDVYSFGIVMWQMITRREPFGDDVNMVNIGAKVMEGQRPEIPSNCPEDMKAMIKRCWKRKPRSRPTMDELIEFFAAKIDAADRV